MTRAGAALGEGIIDGEVVALDAHGVPDFAALQAALSSGRTQGLVLFVFDLLFDGGEDLRGLPLGERKTRLAKMLKAAGLKARNIRFVEHFDSGGDAVLKSACAMNLEGVVSKRLDSPYVSGRSDAWTKAKCRGGQEVVIAGWMSEGAAPLRSLIAGVYRDGALIRWGGSARALAARRSMRSCRACRPRRPRCRPSRASRPPRTRRDPLGAPSAGGRDRIRRLDRRGPPEAGELQGAARGQTRAGVVAESVAPIVQVSKPAGPVVLGVTLSHPERRSGRALGDAAAVTKRDLAAYFEAVGPAMLPHIIGRRAPSCARRTASTESGSSSATRWPAPHPF